jgi:hypothetical protein
MKCCIYTRLYNESPYINFFLNYYLNLGFCKFIFLKADNIPYQIYKIYEPFVIIKEIKNLPGETELSTYSYLIRQSKCDWVLGCDIDEFIVLHKKFNTIQDFIKEKLEINPFINMFFLRWGNLFKFNNNKESFNYIINNYKIYKEKDIKSLVKITPYIIMGHPHLFKNNLPTYIYRENEILNQLEINNPISPNSYEEIFLLHLNIRSLDNLMIKALDNGKNWKINYTFIKNIKDLHNFLNLKVEDIDIDKFINVTGGRLIPPFSKNDSDLACINLNNFNITNLETHPINYELESKLLIKILNKYRVDLNKYKNCINFINDIYHCYFLK